VATATAVQFFTNCILRHITSFKSWVNIIIWSCEFTFYLLTCQSLLHINVQIMYCLVNYGVVLLLGVVSLMAGSATRVSMSPGYGGYQTATPPPYYTTTTFAKTSCNTTKAPEYYTTTYDVPSYYTETPKYKSAPSYITKEPEYYTDAPKYYTNNTRLRMLPLPTTPSPLIQQHRLPREAAQLLHHNLRCPELLHRRPEVLLCVKWVI
jgi:hypothetical protein